VLWAIFLMGRVMRRVFLMILPICLTVLIITETALAVSEENTGEGSAHGIDPIVLGGLAVFLLIAKLGGEFFERIRQPTVLGELLGGIIIGNLAIIGFMGFETLKTNTVVGALAEIGVIILLFQVGLESNIGEMLEVGWSSLLVALAGVIAPFFLLPSGRRDARSYLHRRDAVRDKRRDHGACAQRYGQITGARIAHHSGSSSNR
jgi:Sodium/hydrogen exchanger family